eukprot:g9413.t1
MAFGFSLYDFVRSQFLGSLSLSDCAPAQPLSRAPCGRWRMGSSDRICPPFTQPVRRHPEIVALEEQVANLRFQANLGRPSPRRMEELQKQTRKRVREERRAFLANPNFVPMR